MYNEPLPSFTSFADIFKLLRTKNYQFDKVFSSQNPSKFYEQVQFLTQECLNDLDLLLRQAQMQVYGNANKLDKADIAEKVLALDCTKWVSHLFAKKRQIVRQSFLKVALARTYQILDNQDSSPATSDTGVRTHRVHNTNAPTFAQDTAFYTALTRLFQKDDASQLLFTQNRPTIVALQSAIFDRLERLTDQELPAFALPHYTPTTPASDIPTHPLELLLAVVLTYLEILADLPNELSVYGKNPPKCPKKTSQFYDFSVLAFALCQSTFDTVRKPNQIGRSVRLSEKRFIKTLNDQMACADEWIDLLGLPKTCLQDNITTLTELVKNLQDNLDQRCFAVQHNIQNTNFMVNLKPVLDIRKIGIPTQITAYLTSQAIQHNIALENVVNSMSAEHKKATADNTDNATPNPAYTQVRYWCDPLTESLPPFNYIKLVGMLPHTPDYQNLVFFLENQALPLLMLAKPPVTSSRTTKEHQLAYAQALQAVGEYFLSFYYVAQLNRLFDNNVLCNRLVGRLSNEFGLPKLPQPKKIDKGNRGRTRKATHTHSFTTCF